MLGDSALEGLEAQLLSFRIASSKSHETLQEVLQKYESLVEDYRSLKSDYEEEKANREKYKKLAKGQERNPFVLVLVDGDGYIFNEQLLKSGSDGGIQAAHLLNKQVKACLSGVDSDCRIMVRVYANLAGLSKLLARARLAGQESRSIAPFTSSFTRAQDLFDFVDVGDKKENVDFKIREMFRVFVENSQCKRIFFAGCHAVGYLSLLTPYHGNERITLVKAASFSPEYYNVGLRVEEFASVFRSKPLHVSIEPSLPIRAPPQKIRTPHASASSSLPYESDAPWRSSRAGNGLSSHYDPPVGPRSTYLGASPSNHEPVAAALPVPTAQTEGLIPINKDGQRLDTFLKKPSNEAWASYQQRAKAHKLCNDYHLGGKCINPGCGFDHSPIDPEALHVMKFILRDHNYPKVAEWVAPADAPARADSVTKSDWTRSHTTDDAASDNSSDKCDGSPTGSIHQGASLLAP